MSCFYVSHNISSNQYIYMTVKWFLKSLLAFTFFFFQDIEKLILKMTYFLIIFQQNKPKIILLFSWGQHNPSLSWLLTFPLPITPNLFANPPALIWNRSRMQPLLTHLTTTTWIEPAPSLARTLQTLSI